MQKFAQKYRRTITWNFPTLNPKLVYELYRNKDGRLIAWNGERSVELSGGHIKNLLLELATEVSREEQV